MIDLFPSEYNVSQETFLYTDFKCPECNGRGNYMIRCIKEDNAIACPRCFGSGKLTAKVTIVWEAHKKKDVKF